MAAVTQQTQGEPVAGVRHRLGRSLRRSSSSTAEHGRITGLLLSAPTLVLVALFLIYPLEQLVETAFRDGGWGNVSDFFDSSANTKVLYKTFGYSLLVTVVSVLVGSVIAWSLRTTERRWVRFGMWAAIVIPFLMGSVIKLYAFEILLDTHGVINGALDGLGLIGEPLKLLHNAFAVVLGLTYQMLPFAILPLLAGFGSIDPELAKAAESLGASRLAAVRDTILPLALPSLFATATIVYVVTLGFFLTPAVLGGPSSPFTAALIQQDVFNFFDMTTAAVSALMLLVGSLLVLGVSYLLVGRERLRRAAIG